MFGSVHLDVQPLVGLLGMLAALVAVNLAGLVAIALYRRGATAMSIALLCALFWGTHTQFWMVVGAATSEYSLGDPTLQGSSRQRPDPVDRLAIAGPTRSCCTCDARWYLWNDATLHALTWLLGPSPRAYRGPYPSRDEASLLLATRGVAPALSEGRMTADDVEWGQRTRILVLDEEAVLVRTDHQIQIRRWGRVWASWELDPHRQP